MTVQVMTVDLCWWASNFPTICSLSSWRKLRSPPAICASTMTDMHTPVSLLTMNSVLPACSSHSGEIGGNTDKLPLPQTCSHLQRLCNGSDLQKLLPLILHWFFLELQIGETYKMHLKVPSVSTCFSNWIGYGMAELKNTVIYRALKHTNFVSGSDPIYQDWIYCSQQFPYYSCMKNTHSICFSK